MGERTLYDNANSGQQRVRSVIEAAARRRVLVLAVEQSALAFTAFFSGMVLLLLLGTQILQWPWLVGLVALGAVLAFVRMRKQMVSRYAVAQLLDRRMQFNDTLSTAWFLLEEPSHEDHSFETAQIERAADTARSVEPARVFPFVWRRAWALAGALAAVAFGLFAVRYLVTSSLDLQRALVPVHLPSFADVVEHIREAGGHRVEKRAALDGARIDPRRQVLPGREGDPQLKDEKGQRAANQVMGSPNGKPSQSSSNSPEQAKKDELAGGKDGKANGDKQDSAKDSQADAKSGNPKAQRGNESGNPAARENSNPQPAPGLMDRMKDALSGMMAKMRPQDQGAGQKKGDPQQRNQEDQKSGDQTAANNGPQSSQPEQNKRNSSDNQGQNREQGAQGQAEAQASEKSPSAQSHASDESADRKGSEAHSGIGRQDGDKATKEAEQLRAMGKLEEIIGKRSANLTGDMTVETRSNHQQLQTQYSGRVAQHLDSGREIDRDEVPVALQKYVREYMEQVRKQANGQ